MTTPEDTELQRKIDATKKRIEIKLTALGKQSCDEIDSLFGSPIWMTGDIREVYKRGHIDGGIAQPTNPTKAEDEMLLRIAEETNKEYDWSEADNWTFAFGSKLRDIYIERRLGKETK